MSAPSVPPTNIIFVVQDPTLTHDNTWYSSDYVTLVFWFSIVLICLLWCVGESATRSRRYTRYAPQQAATLAAPAAAGPAY
jgi:hypothetical protein